MMLVAVLSTLLSLPLPMVPGASALDADDFARGFGASAEQLVNAIGELEALGLPVRLELTLEQADGALATDAKVLAAWRGERSLLQADAEGRVRLSLDDHRLDTLQLQLPEGTRAEIAIPWLDELGFAADCPDSETLLRAAGC